MEICLRCGRWALAGLLGLLFICGILMMARPEACVRADLIESCTNQWQPACAQLFMTTADLSKPAWCTTYNYGVFFATVFGAAGLILIGAPLVVALILDKVVNAAMRWISLATNRRV